MRTLEEIKAEVDQMVKDREERINLLMMQHDQAVQNEAAANEKAQKAYTEMDVKEYHKALDEARSNKDAAAMFLAKKNEIEGTPYIDKEKYESLVSEVYQYLDDYVEKNTKAVIKPLQLFSQIGEATRYELNDGNSFLEYLQTKVYKDDGVRILDGRPVYIRSKKKDYNNYRLASLWSRIKDETLVRELLEDKEAD